MVIIMLTFFICFMIKILTLGLLMIQVPKGFESMDDLLLTMMTLSSNQKLGVHGTVAVCLGILLGV